MAKFSVATDRVADAAADLLALAVYAEGQPGPGVKEALDALELTLEDLIARAPQLGEVAIKKPTFTGDLGDAIAVDTLGKLPAKTLLLIGLGKKADAKGAVAVKAGAMVARRAGGAASVATNIPRAIKGNAEVVVQGFVEGFLLGSYRYLKFKTEQNGSMPNKVEAVTLLGDKKQNARALKAAIERAEHIAGGTTLARDLTNLPAGDKSPELLAEEARKIARDTKMKITVLDEKQLEAKGFGGLLGVGRGSPKPPRLVELRYEPPGAKRTIAFVGKGITFDSGGINLKPGTSGIDWMKMDMGGAGAVLGAMHAIGRIKPKGVAVRAYIATAENMPDGNALHPGDVITQYGGKTVEIGNTDAEGRLVMADAIVYAKERGADVIIDIATLTGACVMALGNKVFGVFAEPRSEARKMLDAAQRAGEKGWELPVEPDYLGSIKSDIADLRNVALVNPGAGATLAALFLKEFAGDTTWIHLDIAGTAKADKDEFENPKWATGSGVRTLVEYVLSL